MRWRLKNGTKPTTAISLTAKRKDSDTIRAYSKLLRLLNKCTCLLKRKIKLAAKIKTLSVKMDRAQTQIQNLTCIKTKKLKQSGLTITKSVPRTNTRKVRSEIGHLNSKRNLCCPRRRFLSSTLTTMKDQLL